MPVDLPPQQPQVQQITPEAVKARVRRVASDCIQNTAALEALRERVERARDTKPDNPEKKEAP